MSEFARVEKSDTHGKVNGILYWAMKCINMNIIIESVEFKDKKNNNNNKWELLIERNGMEYHLFWAMITSTPSLTFSWNNKTITTTTINEIERKGDSQKSQKRERTRKLERTREESLQMIDTTRSALCAIA